MAEKVQHFAKNAELEKRENSASKTRAMDFSQSMISPIDSFMFLQRAIGNQAVQRLIKSGTLQAKLKIGQPSDKYEQEADQVADAVMRMPEPGVQRQVVPEEEEIRPNRLPKRSLHWFKGRSSQKRRKKNFRQKRLQVVSLKFNLLLNLIYSPLKEAASLCQNPLVLTSSRVSVMTSARCGCILMQSRLQLERL